MKKILLSTASIFLSIGAFAQLPVSTTPENQNVVLEEFTGIHCTWCPDGHLRAADIKAQNPNDFFIINIHEGGFATPGAGEPDFRTTYGTAIGALANSASVGWPSGSINRHVFSGTAIAHSRGDWAANTATVIAQPSYVNIAVEADIDVATRVMTADLEAYFTAAGPAAVNINIAITQDNIEGPQTGASKNPGSVLPNGNYNHGHVFRHLLTGQWGDVVTTTSMGTTVTKQYTWTIPMDINGVPVEIGELNIVAFIAEGQTEVVTANDGPISFTVPPGITLVDLETANQTPTPSDYCVSTITPKVYITNNETATCSGYKVSYSINGGTPVEETVTTPLSGGASVSHTFAPANITAGSQNIAFNIEITSATEIEIVTGNNTSAAPTFLTISQTVSTPPKLENFESVAATEIPSGAYVDGNMSLFYTVNFTYLDAIGSPSGTDPVGGNGASDNSILFFFWNNAEGTTSSIFFDKIDLTNKESASFSMDHAYTPFEGSNDKLEVFISEDCGATWVSIWVKSGADLKTADEINSQSIFFSPKTGDWASDVISLDAYVGKEIMVKLTGTSDFGDCLYVDNINIDGITTGINELFSSSLVRTFPNPANENVTVSINADKAALVNITVTDVVGKVVFTQTGNQIVEGENNILISTAKFDGGFYFITLTENGLTTTKRIVVQH